MGTGDPWVPANPMVMGLGHILNPSWVIGFLTDGFYVCGHGFGMAKPNRFVPVAIPGHTAVRTAVRAQATAWAAVARQLGVGRTEARREARAGGGTPASDVGSGGAAARGRAHDAEHSRARRPLVACGGDSRDDCRATQAASGDDDEARGERRLRREG